jgi:hypothetical protein
MDMDDDLAVVRNILHTNMLLCLLIVQILFLFGINQTKYKVIFSIMLLILYLNLFFS